MLFRLDIIVLFIFGNTCLKSNVVVNKLKEKDEDSLFDGGDWYMHIFTEGDSS